MLSKQYNACEDLIGLCADTLCIQDHAIDEKFNEKVIDLVCGLVSR